jgi:hypothetical protein
MRRVPCSCMLSFSCFAHPYSFSRCQGRRFTFSCFTCLDLFSAFPRASSLVFIFYAHGLISHGTEGVGSRFHVLSTHTLFRRCRGRRLPFSYFTRPDSFLAFPRASSIVFIFCAHGLVSHGTNGVGSQFQVVRSQTRFRGIAGIGSHFHVLRARNHFRRYRGRRVPFSYLGRPNSFPTVPKASGPVFKFCAPSLVFDSTTSIASFFHVLRALTRFRRYRGRRLTFSCFAVPDTL